MAEPILSTYVIRVSKKSVADTPSNKATETFTDELSMNWFIVSVCEVWTLPLGRKERRGGSNSSIMSQDEGKTVWNSKSRKMLSLPEETFLFLAVFEPLTSRSTARLANHCIVGPLLFNCEGFVRDYCMYSKTLDSVIGFQSVSHSVHKTCDFEPFTKPEESFP